MPASSVPTTPTAAGAAPGPVPGKRQAITSLTLGCLGWYFVGTIIGPFVVGTVGVWQGFAALEKINRTEDRLFRGHAIAGICLSAMGMAGSLLLVFLLLVVMPWSLR